MSDRLTLHAHQRAANRQIPEAAIEATLHFGRSRQLRGAEIFTLGWREVRYWEPRFPDISRWEGTEVVCAHDGTILTVYRNKNSRALRDREQRRAA